MVDVQILKKVSLFESLDASELEALAAIVRIKDFIAGDYIFSEGAPAHSLFLIQSGTIEIYNKGVNEDVKIATLGAGSHFGEIPFFDPVERTGSAEARENTLVYEIDYSDLEALIKGNPALGMKFCKAVTRALCKRIRQTTHDLSSLKELKLRSV